MSAEGTAYLSTAELADLNNFIDFQLPESCQEEAESIVRGTYIALSGRCGSDTIRFIRLVVRLDKA